MPQPSQSKDILKVDGAEKLEDLVVQSSAIYDEGVTGQLENVQYYIPSDPELSLLPISVHSQDIEISKKTETFLDNHQKTKDDLLFFKDSDDEIWPAISDHREGLVLFSSDCVSEKSDNKLYVRTLTVAFETFNVAYTDPDKTESYDRFDVLEYRDLPADPREFQQDERFLFQAGSLLQISRPTPYGNLTSEELSDSIPVQLNSSFISQYQNEPNKTHHFNATDNSEIVISSEISKLSVVRKFMSYVTPITIGVIVGSFIGLSEWGARVSFLGVYSVVVVLALAFLFSLTDRIQRNKQPVGEIRQYEDNQLLSLPFRLNANPISDEENYHLLEVAEVSDNELKFEDYDSGETVTVESAGGVLDPNQLDFLKQVGIEEVTSGQLIAVEIQEVTSTESNELQISSENHTYSGSDISLKPFR